LLELLDFEPDDFELDCELFELEPPDFPPQAGTHWLN
jgi:hypothetical protein